MILGQRLRHTHIQCRPGQPVGIQRLHQGLLVNGGAPAYVHNIGIPRQEGDALPGEDMRRLLGARQSHDQDLCFRQDAVQLIQRVHFVVGGVAGFLGATHAPHHLGAQCLGPAGEVGADVAGTQNGDAAAADGAHGQSFFPAALAHDLLKDRHLPQKHQCHHDDMLRYGDAIGSGGVGQQYIGMRINVVTGVGVHSREAAAQPTQVHGGLYILGGAQTVNDLIVCRLIRRQMPVAEIIHGKTAFCCGFFDGLPVFRGKE